MMQPDDDLRSQLSSLRDKVGEIEGTVRVIKHDLPNMKMAQDGLGSKLEKIEDRLGARLDKAEGQLSTEIKNLSNQLTAVTMKQEKGASFYAGVIAVLTVCLTIVMGLAKVLFGAQQ